MSPHADDLDQLAEELRLCRLELAQVRAGQEPVMEELAQVRHQLETTRARFQGLSRQVDDGLQRLPVGTALPTRARRWTTRQLRMLRAQRRDAELIRRSPLFDGPWYLRKYPDVVATGLPPALHYLRHGAADGLDPGPRFNTRDYLSSHPDVASSGTNPLLHHLQNSGGAAPGTRP